MPSSRTWKSWKAKKNKARKMEKVKKILLSITLFWTVPIVTFTYASITGQLFFWLFGGYFAIRGIMLIAEFIIKNKQGKFRPKEEDDWYGQN